MTAVNAWDRVDLDVLVAVWRDHAERMEQAYRARDHAEETRQRRLMVLHRRFADLVRDMREVPEAERPALPGKVEQ